MSGIGTVLDLQLYPYKVQVTKQLKPANYLQHRTYVEWVLEQQAVGGNFSVKNFSSAMKHISHSVDILVNKIVVFGVLRIHM